MDSSPSETDELVRLVPLEGVPEAMFSSDFREDALPESVISGLCTKAGAENCNLSVNEFAGVVAPVGARVNHSLLEIFEANRSTREAEEFVLHQRTPGMFRKRKKGRTAGPPVEGREFGLIWIWCGTELDNHRN